MDFSLFLKRLLFHISAAVAAFGGLAVALEFVMPGSVTPYLNPIPFVIVGLAGLAIDAAIRPVESRPLWRRIALAILAIVLASVFAFAAFGTDGKASIAAIIFVIIGVGVGSWGMRNGD